MLYSMTCTQKAKFSCALTGEWAYITGHTIVKGEGGADPIPAPLPLAADHLQYYKTLFTVITGPSNDLFKVGSHSNTNQY